MSLTADLTGKRILVTGASSEGFGAHFARLLAKKRRACRGGGAAHGSAGGARRRDHRSRRQRERGADGCRRPCIGARRAGGGRRNRYLFNF